jgi:hypothetical protein
MSRFKTGEHIPLEDAAALSLVWAIYLQTIVDKVSTRHVQVALQLTNKLNFGWKTENMQLRPDRAVSKWDMLNVFVTDIRFATTELLTLCGLTGEIARRNALNNVAIEDSAYSTAYDRWIDQASDSDLRDELVRLKVMCGIDPFANLRVNREPQDREDWKLLRAEILTWVDEQICDPMGGDFNEFVRREINNWVEDVTHDAQPLPPFPSEE